jgi:hypothetical protein
LLFLNKIRNAFKSGGHSQEETLPKDWVWVTFCCM